MTNVSKSKIKIIPRPISFVLKAAYISAWIVMLFNSWGNIHDEWFGIVYFVMILLAFPISILLIFFGYVLGLILQLIGTQNLENVGLSYAVNALGEEGLFIVIWILFAGFGCLQWFFLFPKAWKNWLETVRGKNIRNFRKNLEEHDSEIIEFNNTEPRA